MVYVVILTSQFCEVFWGQHFTLKCKVMKTHSIQKTLVPFAICFCLSLALFPDTSLDIEKYSTNGLELEFVKPHLDEDIAEHSQGVYIQVSAFSPVLVKDYHGFKEALGFKESGGNYFSVNTYGYMGKYQFGIETLKMIGVYDAAHFMSSPEMQEMAFLANTKRNKWILRKYIQHFQGETIGGVEVTESGILAAAHLAGPGSVIKFLGSDGNQNFKDGYGSTLSEYMQRFSGYDTSDIKPDKKAKVRI